jgi:hypothetical protein
MALIVFLRGVNVGEHRTFRSSILARELSDYAVVNVRVFPTFPCLAGCGKTRFEALVETDLSSAAQF